jgi:hypothetical protein
MARLLEGISSHVYPTLRSTETHGQVDHSISIEIKTYNPQQAIADKSVTLDMKKLNEQKEDNPSV